MLFIETETLEFLGGHVKIMLFIEKEKLEFDFTTNILK